VLHLYFVWAMTLFDFHFFLANTISQPLIYIVRLGYPPLLLMMALQGPSIMVMAKKWVWHPPLLLLLIVSAITVPMAANKELAVFALQYFVIYYAMSLATTIFIRTPAQAIPIIVLMVLQFAWFGLFARTTALVMWHPTLSNLDGFGTLMVQGVAICFWFAMAARKRSLRLFLFGLAAYCVLGVVASYARAAFLSLVAIVGWIWLRSPRKLATGTAIIIAVLVAFAGTLLIFEPGFFWAEITSAFSEGTTEGTGAQRWNLWEAGLKVWMQRPIFGVGGGNFGAFAAAHFGYGELTAFPNPSMLYGYNLHNAYMQVLTEFGLVGLFAFGWAVWDFLKCNRALREPDAVRRWAEKSGGTWDLRYLSLGLEASNVANLLCGLFYASLFMPAFYTTWIVSRMLWGLTRPPESATQPRRSRSAPIQRQG